MNKAVTVLLTAVGLAGWGNPTVAAAKPLELTAAPILGTNAPATAGWVAFTVRLDNRTAGPLAGTLHMSGEPPGRAETPFSLAPHQSAWVELSWHDITHVGLEVEAFDLEGRSLARQSPSSPRGPEPFLLDLTHPSRLTPALQGRSVGGLIGEPRLDGNPDPSLVVTSPTVDPATGAVKLPTLPAGYGSVTVVFATSEMLAGIRGAERTALSNYVLAGGTLAVAVTRPEDRRSGPLPDLLGGPIQVSRAPPEMLAPRGFAVSIPNDMGPPGTRNESAAPSREVSEALHTYQGANLHPAPWGAVATYGLGRIALLGFDPTLAPVVTDRWVQLTLTDLVQRAWQWSGHVALPHGQLGLEYQGVEPVRRILDPNEGARWAVILSAVALVVYSLLAGPLSFQLAARRGKPLNALWWLPIWSLGMLSFIVALGLFAKGGRAKARHLSLIQAGAGMSRGVATRFRALFASSGDELTVRATDGQSLLDLAGDGYSTARVLVRDREGIRLEALATRPWETLLVREDGFAPLGGGVSLVQKTNGDVLVKNRLARDLVGVVVHTPGDPSLYYIDRIEDGALARAREGRRLPVSSVPSGPMIPRRVHPLHPHVFATIADGSHPGLGEAWRSLSEVVAYHVDWWPEDVPVLIGQIDGGEGRLSDSGLPLDMDRVLLRVVGYGGEP